MSKRTSITNANLALLDLDDNRTEADTEFVTAADMITDAERGIDYAVSISDRNKEIQASSELKAVRRAFKTLQQAIALMHPKIVGT